MDEHWFWYFLVVVVMVWYSTVTIYVAIRGALDIKQMLARLGKKTEDAPPPFSRV